MVEPARQLLEGCVLIGSPQLPSEGSAAQAGLS